MTIHFETGGRVKLLGSWETIKLVKRHSIIATWNHGGKETLEISKATIRPHCYEAPTHKEDES